jgi:hypothetical protein
MPELLMSGELRADDYNMEEFHVRNHDSDCARRNKFHPPC